VTTYREDEVARSICSSSGDVEENQPAIMESDSGTICAQASNRGSRAKTTVKEGRVAWGWSSRQPGD